MFNTKQTIILDGALATELETRGADLNDPLWSAKLLVENPALIRQVHNDYLVAGADVIITASYQASFEGFARRGLNAEGATALMQLSVQLANEARDAFWADAHNRENRIKPLVAVSIGPYGATLADGSEYTGNYGMSKEALIDFHRPRMAVFAEMIKNGKADLFACETIPCQIEAEALIEVLTEFPQVKAWLSFSCCDEKHVCHGELFAECVALANASAQIVAVGLNCTPPQYAGALIAQAAQMTEKPIIVYPNSGESWDNTNHTWHTHRGMHDDAFCVMAENWLEAGASVIGGCCRTSPATIQLLQKRFQYDE